MRNPILILATVLAAGALSLGLWSWQQWNNSLSSVSQASHSATLLPSPRALPPVKLINQDGEEVQINKPTGRWNLWFFGFTHCPDICPNTLAMLVSIRQAIADVTDRDNLDMTFISVDPQRDTPEKLKAYVEYFDPRMMGLTGKVDAIDRLTASLYLPYALDAADENGQYNVEHSGALVLIGPDATARAYFTAPHDRQALIDDLITLTQKP